MTSTIVLGAGVAGLTAARHLQDHGHTVRVIDKGRGVGGRLATRRMGQARVDHGAQFFTTRGDRFVETVGRAVEAGAVIEWCKGFGEQDGHSRYRGAEGMTSFAKWLARDLDIDLSTRAAAVQADEGGVRFVDADGTVLAMGDNAVVTAPIPQMLDLFDAGNLAAPSALDQQLRSADYFATLALLAVVDGVADIDEPGGMQLEDEPFTFIADNLQKGISPIRALTFHAAHDYSSNRYDDDPEQVLAELIELAAPWLGSAEIADAQLKKWRYAGPIDPLPERTYLIEHGAARVALAGDAFGGPKVEGAFESGHAAAESLL